MTNIPKKLEDTKWQDTFFAIEDLVNKINELIDCLQEKEEASKKDKYLCYTCNQWGVVGEHKCEASKGEKHFSFCKCEKCRPDIQEMFNPPASKGECLYFSNCKKCGKELDDSVHRCNPPEHVESFVPTLTKWQREQLDKHYVSKEKIKREIEHLYFSGICFMQTNPSGREIFSEQVDKSKKSLGLGD